MSATPSNSTPSFRAPAPPIRRFRTRNRTRILLEDLARPEVRDRLALILREPQALDPTRASARVTREVAAHLAEVARSLEAAGNPAQKVAGFLT